MPELKIEDLRSFRETTGEPRQVAGLYWHKLMDPLVSLAHVVALDFVRRPQLYTTLGEEGPVLGTLRAAYGTSPELPSDSQRDEIFVAVFGDSPRNEGPGTGDFARFSEQVIAAATAFSERVYETGLPMLRRRFRIQHRLLRDHLLGVHSASVRFSNDVALAGVSEEVAYRVLRAANVAAVFGIVEPPAEPWPYRLDPNGSKLVEQIAQQLSWSGGTAAPLSRHRIDNLQAAAVSGAETLAAIIERDPDVIDDDALDDVIDRAYSWGSNLQVVASA